MARYGSTAVEATLVYTDDEHYCWSHQQAALHAYYCLECSLDFIGGEVEHCPSCHSDSIQKTV